MGKERDKGCPHLSCPAPAEGRWTPASCWRQQLLGLRLHPSTGWCGGCAWAAIPGHILQLSHQPLSTPPSFGANVLMRIIIIIITCTYIYIKPPDPREVSSDCPRKKTFSLCGLWLGTRGPAAPRSGTNYRGAEPSAGISLIPGVWSLSNGITWGGWKVSGVPSVLHFGLGQGGWYIQLAALCSHPAGERGISFN